MNTITHKRTQKRKPSVANAHGRKAQCRSKRAAPPRNCQQESPKPIRAEKHPPKAPGSPQAPGKRWLTTCAPRGRRISDPRRRWFASRAGAEYPECVMDASLMPIPHLRCATKHASAFHTRTHAQAHAHWRTSVQIYGTAPQNNTHQTSTPKNKRRVDVKAGKVDGGLVGLTRWAAQRF